MLLPSTTPFCGGARPSAAVRARVKTEARLQQPPEACSRSAPLKEDQKVTFDLKEIVKMSFMSDTTGAISKLIQEELSIKGSQPSGVFVTLQQQMKQTATPPA